MYLFYLVIYGLPYVGNYYFQILYMSNNSVKDTAEFGKLVSTTKKLLRSERDDIYQ